ncbi:uncharacterized protein LOC100179815 isoform X1 [Ciona intestinalis]
MHTPYNLQQSESKESCNKSSSCTDEVGNDGDNDDKRSTMSHVSGDRPKISAKAKKRCPLGYSTKKLNLNDDGWTTTDSEPKLDCCCRTKSQLAGITTKVDQLEESWKIIRKKFKLHEDNIDEMQERLYLYEHGTPGTFFANVKYYIALVKCTIVPFVIVEVIHRVLF